MFSRTFKLRVLRLTGLMLLENKKIFHFKLVYSLSTYIFKMLLFSCNVSPVRIIKKHNLNAWLLIRSFETLLVVL